MLNWLFKKDKESDLVKKLKSKETSIAWIEKISDPLFFLKVKNKSKPVLDFFYHHMRSNLNKKRIEILSRGWVAEIDKSKFSYDVSYSGDFTIKVWDIYSEKLIFLFSFKRDINVFHEKEISDCGLMTDVIEFNIKQQKEFIKEKLSQENKIKNQISFIPEKNVKNSIPRKK